jgi:hypothetical protein
MIKSPAVQHLRTPHPKPPKRRSKLGLAPVALTTLFASFAAFSIFMFASPARAAQSSVREDDKILEELLQGSPKTFSEIVIGPPESSKMPPPEFSYFSYIPARHLSKLLKKIEPLKKLSKKNPEPYRACVNGIIAYQCENSPYKDLNFSERYKEFEILVEARFKKPEIAEALADYRNAPACIAARETGRLEPISISWLNCQRDTFVTDLGLGQITLQTFLYSLGLDDKEVSDTLKMYTGKMEIEENFNKKKKIFYPAGSHLRLSEGRARELPLVTEVHPFDTDEYRQDPMRMYEEMADSAGFQVDMMLVVLINKKNRNKDAEKTLTPLKVKSENSKFTAKSRKYWAGQLKSSKALFEKETFEYYNAGEFKKQYAEAIYACKSCLDAGVEDAMKCLGFSWGKKDFKGSKLCTK